MTESQMESYLIAQGFDIWDSDEEDDKCIDSTKVIDIADDLGYKAILNENSVFYFYKK